MTGNLKKCKKPSRCDSLCFFKYMYKPIVVKQTPSSVTIFRLVKISVYKNKLF